MNDLVAVGPAGDAGLVLRDAKAIKLGISNVGKAVAKLNPMVHEVAVQTLLHAATHGDYTLVGKLLGGNVNKDGKVEAGVLGKETVVRVQGLRVWVQEFLPLRWNGDGKLGVVKGDKHIPLVSPEALVKVAEANATPFWMLSAADEKTAKPLDVGAILKLVAGLDKRIDKQVADGVQEAESAAMAKALVAKLAQIKAA